MNDFALVSASPARDDSSAGSLPPQLLARWAAIAGERACLTFLPQQVPQG